MASMRLAQSLAGLMCGITAVRYPELTIMLYLGVVGACTLLAPRVRLLVCLALACGSLDALARQALHPPLQAGAWITTRGVVESYAPQGKSEQAIFADEAGHRFAVRFTEAVRKELCKRLTLVAQVQSFDALRNLGGIDESSLAAARGLDARLLHPRIVRSEELAWNTLALWPQHYHDWANTVLHRRVSPQTQAILAGIIWGEQNELPDDLRSAFLATSTIHILITAGLHVGIVCYLLSTIFEACSLGRNASALLALPFLWIYAYLTGDHVPVLRATLTATLILCTRALGMRVHRIDLLLLSACLIALIDPFATTTLSCALSYSCVAAILAFTEYFERRLTYVPRPLRAALSVTLAAQCGTFALLAVGMHRISLIACVANLLVVPLVGILMPTGIALLVVSAAATILHESVVNDVLSFLALCCTGFVAWIVSVVNACGSLPYASLMVPAPNLTSILFTYSALAATAFIIHGQEQDRFFLGYRIAIFVHHYTSCSFDHAFSLIQRRIAGTFREGRREQYALLCLLLAVTPICTSAFAPDVSSDLRITMLDVGQGDGIVLRTPRGHTILIDTGGALELHAQMQHGSFAERLAGNVLLPYLAQAHIHAVDLMILTHPHGDHVGGAAPLMRALPVYALWDSGQYYTGPAYLDARREASMHHIPIVFAHRGMSFTTDDGVRLDVLNPFVPESIVGTNAVNENSIVVRLSFHNRRILFMGDAGRATEQRLLAMHDDLRADILKVGHHGSSSASSSEFLAAVRPRIALISVGRRNLFGHPTAVTLTSLKNTGTAIYRTDVCGAITILGLEIHTFIPCTPAMNAQPPSHGARITYATIRPTGDEH